MHSHSVTNSYDNCCNFPSSMGWLRSEHLGCLAMCTLATLSRWQTICALLCSASGCSKLAEDRRVSNPQTSAPALQLSIPAYLTMSPASASAQSIFNSFTSFSSAQSCRTVLGMYIKHSVIALAKDIQCEPEQLLLITQNSTPHAEVWDHQDESKLQTSKGSLRRKSNRNTWEKRLRKPRLCCSEKRKLRGDVIASFTREKELMEEMETDASQMYTGRPRANNHTLQQEKFRSKLRESNSSQ